MSKSPPKNISQQILMQLLNPKKIDAIDTSEHVGFTFEIPRVVLSYDDLPLMSVKHGLN